MITLLISFPRSWHIHTVETITANPSAIFFKRSIQLEAIDLMLNLDVPLGFNMGHHGVKCKLRGKAWRTRN
jgi:hypothetical protein